MSKRVLFLIAINLLLAGCAHVISKDIRDKTDPSLTFENVFQNPNTYKGKTVVLGGEIVEARNQKDGTTEIEVFQLPLDFREAPKVSDDSKGRFLMRINKYLDPYLYQKGRKITVAGEILGEKVQPLGEMSYRYPVIAGQQIHLWDEAYYLPQPYSYYPWGYYDPWWGYPCWWGGFGYYYHDYPNYYHHHH